MYSIKDPFEQAKWYLIAYKILYYHPELFPKWESPKDQVYDEIEKGYLKQCLDLGAKNEFVHKTYPEYKNSGTGMMEIDFNHPKVSEVFKFMEQCRE